MSWYKNEFGQEEDSGVALEKQFKLEDEDKVMVSLANNRRFYLGPFTSPSVAELRTQYNSLLLQQKQTKEAAGSSSPSSSVGKPLQFEHVVGDVRTLICDRSPDLPFSVFQAASQFNCLEMVGPSVLPERGVTIYANDRTQGPACAMSCPAATVYRNYFVPHDQAGRVVSLATQGGMREEKGGEKGVHRGQLGGERCQLNMLTDFDCLVANGDRSGNGKTQPRFWQMQNGYCIPSSKTSIGELGALLLANEGAMMTQARDSLRVGIHWETEVKKKPASPSSASDSKAAAASAKEKEEEEGRRVCQVYSSALPVAYAKGTPSSDWGPFACAVLEGTFEATLTASAIIALQRKERVTVYLTAVGGGVFGNRTQWIVDAIQRALLLPALAAAPLDVKLVHYGSLPRDAFSTIKAAPSK